MDQFLWTEKYRPSTLDGYIGNESFKNKVQAFIDSSDVPHILLSGVQGTGKTTAAKIITNNIECDVLYINASDENNVETVRNKIKNFASSLGFSKLKVVILDEADYMTPNAQAALRNMMETFSKSTRFILTCNYTERIIDPVISRTQHFKIYPPSKAEVAKHMVNVLKQEGVVFELADLKVLIDAHFPDIRKIINECQSNSSGGSLSVEKSSIIESDFKLKTVELLKESANKYKTFNEIRQLVADAGVREFIDVYSFLYEKVDEFSSPNVISANILILNEGQFRDAMVVDKEINFMATISQLLN